MRTVSHAICALVIVGGYDRDVAAKIDLRVVAAYEDVSVMPVDHYYSTFWAKEIDVTGELDLPLVMPASFPREQVLLHIVRDLTGKRDPKFALIMTDYGNGNEGQWAAAYTGSKRISGESATINDALRAIGVTRRYPKDEFDTIGLSAVGHNPRHLAKYRDWCAEHDGVVQAVVQESLTERMHQIVQHRVRR